MVSTAYNTDWTLKVCPGLECKIVSGGRTHTYRVTSLEAPEGFWRVIMLDGPFLAQLYSLSEQRIRADATTA